MLSTSPPFPSLPFFFLQSFRFFPEGGKKGREKKRECIELCSTLAAAAAPITRGRRGTGGRITASTTASSLCCTYPPFVPSPLFPSITRPFRTEHRCRQREGGRVEKRSCPLLSLLARLRACVSAWTGGAGFAKLFVSAPNNQSASFFGIPASPVKFQRLSNSVPCLITSSLPPKSRGCVRSFVRSCGFVFLPFRHVAMRKGVAPSLPPFSPPPCRRPLPNPSHGCAKRKGKGGSRGCFLYTRSRPPPPSLSQGGVPPCLRNKKGGE